MSVPDSVVTAQVSELDISGPLQARVMTMLRDESLCGVDMMDRLKLKSPGTIYPVLEELEKRGLISYRVERTGAVRRKMFTLTKAGAEKLRVHLASSARVFACDVSSCLGRIMEDVKSLVEIKPNQEVLSTVQYEGLESFLRSTRVTYSNDLTNIPQNNYDLVLSFLGVGYLVGRKGWSLPEYVTRLHRSLKRGGRLLTVEVEKTDNLFARIIFEDIVGLKESPGLQKNELEATLRKAGFEDTVVTSKSGLLYGFSKRS